MRLGMLDWGIGGLGCYRLIKAAQPERPIVYWSDTGAVPYGKLPRAALARRVESALAALCARGATHLVVACNAASTVLDRISLPVPTTGIIEHAVASVPPTLRGTLAVIGGARTIRSGVYRRALERPGLRVRSRVAQPLSAHIEAGTSHSDACQAEIARILAPVAEADALLLACTHYPAIAAALAARLRPEVLVLDPAVALARAVTEAWPLAQPCSEPDRFLTTGSAGSMQSAAASAWDLDLPACEEVSLP